MCVLYVWYGIVVCLLLERGPLWVFLEATAMGEIYTPSKTHKLYRNTMVLIIFIAFFCSKAPCIQFLYFLGINDVMKHNLKEIHDRSQCLLRNVNFYCKKHNCYPYFEHHRYGMLSNSEVFVLEYVVSLISSMSLLSKLRKEKSVCSKSALGCWKASELASFVGAVYVTLSNDEIIRPFSLSFLLEALLSQVWKMIAEHEKRRGIYSLKEAASQTHCGSVWSCRMFMMGENIILARNLWGFSCNGDKSILEHGSCLQSYIQNSLLVSTWRCKLGSWCCGFVRHTFFPFPFARCSVTTSKNRWVSWSFKRLLYKQAVKLTFNLQITWSWT